MKLMHTQKQAAARLGVSVPSFVKYVRPHVKAVQIGEAARYSDEELQRWVAEAGKSL